MHAVTTVGYTNAIKKTVTTTDMKDCLKQNNVFIHWNVCTGTNATLGRVAEFYKIMLHRGECQLLQMLQQEVYVSGHSHEEGLHFTFPLDVCGPVELVPDVRRQHLQAVLRHVDLPHLPRGVHTTGYVHRVPPNVVEHLLSADDP